MWANRRRTTKARRSQLRDEIAIADAKICGRYPGVAAHCSRGQRFDTNEGVVNAKRLSDEGFRIERSSTVKLTLEKADYL